MEAVAARIDTLLAQFAVMADADVRARAQELVKLLMELYGTGLARMLGIVQRGADGDALIAALARDELVASLLVLHDLHPEDSTVRIARALERVRDVAGAEVALVELREATARVQVREQRRARAPSPAELVRLIEGVVRAAAPDVAAVEVDGLTAAAPLQLVQLTYTRPPRRERDVPLR